MHVVDLFAGAGGFSLGFHQAGFAVAAAFEVDGWAAETLQTNHESARVVCRDVRAVTNRDFERAVAKQPDVVVGGPPCQGFSVCNRNNGDPTDPRNTLFAEFLRGVKVWDPSVALVENVPNLVKARTADRRLVLDVIVEELTALGYHVYHDTLEATDYGIPQIRRRLFVLASKRSLAEPFPPPTHRVGGKQRDLISPALPATPTLWDAISDLPELEAGEGFDEARHERPAANAYQEMLRAPNRWYFNHTAMRHTSRMVERFAAMEWGQNGGDVPEHLRARRRNSLEISEAVYSQNNRRMHPDRPCHTVPASFYANFVHPFQHRNFTPREGARIQSFPDSYRFCGKPTVVSHKLLKREGRDSETFLCQYNQIGNAVPPLMARRIAEHLLTNLRKSDARPRRKSHREGAAPNKVPRPRSEGVSR